MDHSASRRALSDAYLDDEAACVERLIDYVAWTDLQHDTAKSDAVSLIERARQQKQKTGSLESFLQSYPLSSEEGLALMALAEALLRIPDSYTANLLIRDKVTAAEWLQKEVSDSAKRADWLTKAAGMGLALSRKTLESMIGRLGEPVIRTAMAQAIQVIGHQFVLGETIEKAIKTADNYRKGGYRLSYDMLGEGARTAKDAARYFDHYDAAIQTIGVHQSGNKTALNHTTRDGISVKLSALHPRYDIYNEARCVPELAEKLVHLCELARDKGIALTVDAEECDRLDLSIDIIERVMAAPSLKSWEGFGLAVQAYHKRALPLIRHLETLIKSRIQVRLVKGAYWDTEIKHTQELGLSDYPVFTRKINTDVSFLACAKALLDRRDIFYPMLATHNAYSIGAIRALAGSDQTGYEFQRLHGMGDSLYDIVRSEYDLPVCVYAPVGSHRDLLPYLVRRLLENGANSSFVHQLLDPETKPEDLAENPVLDAANHESKRHPHIPLPRDIYGSERKNSEGVPLSDTIRRLEFLDQIAQSKNLDTAAPIINGKTICDGIAETVINPARNYDLVGKVHYARPREVEQAFEICRQGFEKWNRTPVDARATIIERYGDLLQKNMPNLIALLQREAGKTVDDAIAEVREAIDFCRYYAVRARHDFALQTLSGPTGEKNFYHLEGRGVFVCISPWNFPLAIFTGQIVAALVAGNAVIAKPAEQTGLIASKAVSFMLEAGLPADAIALLHGDGKIGEQIIAHPNVAGVAFTGSTGTAKVIYRQLGQKDGPIVPLIAETGGQNAMIVDASALAEQVVDDVIHSAFGSAGQRCSALRVLYLQRDIADHILDMLKGAVSQLNICETYSFSADIGPVINETQRAMLVRHREHLKGFARKIVEAPITDGLVNKGTFFTPSVWEIESITQLKEEIFGPILHVIRYDARDLNIIIDEINSSGYGLTFGIHSRIQKTHHNLIHALNAGNIYVNRGMTGAVVGVQPFGGHGLSGTGPKAGGPHYLPRFAEERSISIDTTASGGNATLVSLEED